MNFTQTASIINQIAYELEQDNDRAERRRQLEKMVAEVNRTANAIQGIHKSVFPNGTWGDADRIHAKLRDMREAGI